MSRKQGERLIAKDILSSNKDALFFDQFYKNQLKWTKSTRKYIYRKINLLESKIILEVGSGTGALLEELVDITDGINVIGLDINIIALEYCRTNNHHRVIHGDGNFLPFQDNNIDIVICNYLLLWLNNPVQVLKEFSRITKPGGWVVCLAEPDYKGRQDQPYGDIWKKLYYSSLSAPGPDVGRKLKQIFSKANLEAEIGLQSIPQVSNAAKEMYEDEIRSLERFIPTDSYDLLKKIKKLIAKTNISEMKLFMPVYYAFAKKRKN